VPSLSRPLGGIVTRPSNALNCPNSSFLFLASKDVPDGASLPHIRPLFLFVLFGFFPATDYPVQYLSPGLAIQSISNPRTIFISPLLSLWILLGDAVLFSHSTHWTSLNFLPLLVFTCGFCDFDDFFPPDNGHFVKNSPPKHFPPPPFSMRPFPPPPVPVSQCFFPCRVSKV